MPRFRDGLLRLHKWLRTNSGGMSQLASLGSSYARSYRGGEFCLCDSSRERIFQSEDKQLFLLVDYLFRARFAKMGYGFRAVKSVSVKTRQL